GRSKGKGGAASTYRLGSRRAWLEGPTTTREQLMSAEAEDNNQRQVLAVVLLTALALSLCAGVLSWLGGAAVAMAGLYGGTAFGRVTLFILAILNFLRAGK